MFDFQSAEFSTVGALLIDGSCLELVRPVLPNGEAFGNPACRKAYEAVCALADQGKPIDPVTVGRLSGLVQTRSTKQTEYERVTQISGDLKRMARRLNCVVLALCQLNRESVSPVCDSLPKLSQLRSSGALEQDADGVLLLHRNAPSDPQDPSQPQPFYINVAKNRHGRTGTVELNWYPPVNRFEDRSGKWPVMSWR